MSEGSATPLVAAPARRTAPAPARLSATSPTRRPEHKVVQVAGSVGSSGYAWQINGQRVTDLEVNHDDGALYVVDAAHAGCRLDTGHRFTRRPTEDELGLFVSRYAVALLAPLVARAAATAAGWQ